MPTESRSVFGEALSRAARGHDGRFLLVRHDDSSSFECDASKYLEGLFPETLLSAIAAAQPSSARPLVDIGAGSGILMERANVARDSYLPVDNDPAALSLALSIVGHGPSLLSDIGSILEGRLLESATPSCVVMAGGNLGLLGTCRESPVESLSLLVRQCPDGCVLAAHGRDPGADTRHAAFWRGRKEPFYTASLVSLDGALQSQPFRWWMPSMGEAVRSLSLAGWSRVGASRTDGFGGFVATATAPDRRLLHHPLS